jgi:hypothetical protein
VKSLFEADQDASHVVAANASFKRKEGYVSIVGTYLSVSDGAILIR